MNSPKFKLLDGMSYEDLRDYLKTLPSTWYPDLLATMIETAYGKKVFVVGGASAFVSKIERKIGKSA